MKLATEMPDEKIFIVTGLTSQPGDANNNPSLLEEARKMGAQMVEMLAKN